MTITAHNSEKEKPGDSFAALLIGKEQSGKSRLATTAPEPVLFLEFDRKVKALSGIKGVYALAFRDPSSTVMQPTAFTELQDMVNFIEGNRSLKAIGAKVGIADWPDLPVTTLVFDSIQTIAKAASNYILYSNAKELAHVVNIAGRQYRTQRTFHAWGSEMSAVEEVILQARSISGLNVICNLHEAMEEDERSTQENPIYTGRIEVYPVRYRVLLKYFTEVWRLVRSGAGAPVLNAQPDSQFAKAGNTLNILTPVQNPNIKELIAKARASGNIR